jgi:hypothetical protein
VLMDFADHATRAVVVISILPRITYREKYIELETNSRFGIH